MVPVSRLGFVHLRVNTSHSAFISFSQLSLGRNCTTEAHPKAESHSGCWRGEWVTLERDSHGEFSLTLPLNTQISCIKFVLKAKLHVLIMKSCRGYCLFYWILYISANPVAPSYRCEKRSLACVHFSAPCSGDSIGHCIASHEDEI